MRRMITTAAILTISLAAALGAAADAPQITIDQQELDLGSVTQGTSLDVEYEVRNTGNEELEITVRPSCGCTVVEADSTIPAGATGIIRATIDTTKFSGEISKSLMVLTNDPAQRTLKLTAKAVVNPA